MSGFGSLGLFDDELAARRNHIEVISPETVPASAVPRAFKEGKIAGSKSFAKLVKEMRDAQQGFFRNKHGSQAKKDYLAKAKKLEEQVDRSIEIILK